eukprot:266671_1
MQCFCEKFEMKPYAKMVWILMCLVANVSSLTWMNYSTLLPEGVSGQLFGTHQNGLIYLIGGEISATGENKQLIWRFNPVSPNITTITTTTPETQFMCRSQESVSIGNLIYILGVYDGAANGVYDTGKMYIFDMNSEQFINTD